MSRLAAWFVVASVVGQPIAAMQFHWDPLAMALPYLAPAAIFGFLLVLDRAPAGRTRPSRLSDAALAASVVTIAALAASLRWTTFAWLFSEIGKYRGTWLYWIPWPVNQVFEPLAWLVFLVTFVRHPAPPVARARRRAAAGLAVVPIVAGLWPVWSFVESLAAFWFDYPPRGARLYNDWNGVVQGFPGALHWFLLLFFAVAVWRTRPAAETPPAASPD